jgi:Na+/H+ antiporter NhaA
LGMQIDLEPRAHSHLYEVKPMPRWLLVPAFALAALGVLVNGIANPASWYLLMMGIFVGFTLIATNPKKWLSRLD